ncbi:hypothetical protein CRYUN_Cryun05aG0125700 [Craigia yunnanensis]
MEDQADSAMVSKGLVLMPGSDSKLVGVKRSIDDFEDRHEVSPKRIKMRDLDSVIRSEVEEKESLGVWKEMRQNGFLSSSHGVPKQRGRESKNDVLKKMELAKKEQVDSKQRSHVKNGTKDDDGKKDPENMDDSGLHRLSCYHEDGPANTTSISKKARGYLVPIHKPFSSISEERSGDAATVASQWLELFQQDIKGRLSALRRSKKKVRAVSTTELPFLISKQFSSNQGSDPNIMGNFADGFSHDGAAEMHRARWSALFDQMDKALSEEEKQLASCRKLVMFTVI